jgi:hypothetical protein
LDEEEYERRTRAINAIYLKTCKKMGLKEPLKRRYDVSEDIAKRC